MFSSGENGSSSQAKRRQPAAVVLLMAWVVGLVLFVADTQVTHAGGGPENVLLVVNENSPSSKLIANQYIRLRDIPPQNVVYLQSVPQKHTAKLSEFKETILTPIFQAITQRRLSKSIDYIVYSSDFPHRVSIVEHQKALKEAVGGRFQAKIFAPIASLTSATYFADSIRADNPVYMSLDSNWYYRLPYKQASRIPLLGEPLQQYRKAINSIEDQGEAFTAAQKTLKALAKAHPGQSLLHYQLARFYSVEGDDRAAIKAFTRAISLGWRDKNAILDDPKLTRLDGNPLFKGLVDRLEDFDTTYIPAHGFRSAYAWGPNGMINNRSQGRRFYLSAMLSENSELGLSDRESIDYLTRAANADFQNPRGTVYFTQTKNVRSTTRTPLFAAAVEALRGLGRGARVVKQVMPQSRNDVMGLTCGTSAFDWPATESDFEPGAIADNLTSTGASFSRKGQTKITEFLKSGAAGAMGTVVEPYALAAKFPNPMIHAYYARGCTLAEAYYQSVHGPYQILLVADPLCQPFAKPPSVRIASPIPMQPVQGEIDLRIDTGASRVPIAGLELFADSILLKRLRTSNLIKLDTTGLSDGYHEFRLVAVAKGVIETRGRAKLPLIVDNKGFFTKISVGAVSYDVSQTIKVSAESNFGDRISILHNGRKVATIEGQKGEAKILGNILGGGQVLLQAVSYQRGDDQNQVASTPVSVEIVAPILNYPTGLPKSR